MLGTRARSSALALASMLLGVALWVPGARAAPSIPASACYSVEIAGTVDGQSFDTTQFGRTGLLCVRPAIEDPSTPNGRNDLEVCLQEGSYAAGQLGSIQLGTNGGCWTQFSSVDVATVGVDRGTGTVTVQLDGGRADVAGNAFGLNSLFDVYARIAEGAMALSFGEGCRLIGAALDVAGPSLLYGTRKRYTGQVQPNQPNPLSQPLPCPAPAGAGGTTGPAPPGGMPGGGPGPAASPGDITSPTVRAIQSRARRGRLARLRYRVSDDSGQTRERLTVRRFGRRLATIRTKLGAADPMRRYFATWRVPRRVRRPLTFCVRAFDAAGNASSRDCARLTLRR